jgi:hypothetical protein
VPDLFDQTRAEIDARRVELAPRVAEYHELEEALEALGGVEASPGRRRAPDRPRAGTAARPAHQRGTKPAAGRRRAAARRPRRRVSRTDQMLAGITAHPGLTVLELATRLGINPTYAHEVVKRLSRDGTAEARASRWYPTGRTA